MDTQFFVDPSPILPDAPVFTSLQPLEIRAIVDEARKYQVSQGGNLFHQGEAANICYLIVRGQVRLNEVAPGGQQVIVHILDAGHLIALVATIGKKEYPLSAEAMSECLLLGWNNNQFSELMFRFPQLAVNCTRLITNRFLELKSRYRELATERVEQRIANALLRLARNHGRTSNNSIVIDFIVSRQDIAELAGTTLFSVSRTCSQFEQKGLIQTKRDSITILEPATLAFLAETSN